MNERLRVKCAKCNAGLRPNRFYGYPEMCRTCKGTGYVDGGPVLGDEPERGPETTIAIRGELRPEATP